MPEIVSPNEGVGDLLGYMLSAAISGVFGLELGLFVNDITPDADTVFADLTEPSWLSYTRFTLDRDQWTTPTVAAGVATSEHGSIPRVWVNDSADTPTVFGVFYLDPTAGVIRFVQRFEPGDVREIAPGGQVTFLPRVTLTS